MKMKRLLVAVMALAMLITGFTGYQAPVLAASEAGVSIVDEKELTVEPGTTNHVKIALKSGSGYILNPTISIKGDDNTALLFSNIKLTYLDAPVLFISPTDPVNLDFDVKVKETATIKNYPISIIISYTDYMGNAQSYTLNSYLKITQEREPAQLTVSKVSLSNTNVGSDAKLTFTVINEGELTAKNAFLRMDFGDSMEADYTAKDIKVGDLTGGGSKVMTLPVSLLSTATTGKKTLTAKFTYKTEDGTEITSSYNLSVTLTTNKTSPKLLIKDVQFAEGLKPGDKFDLSIVVLNSGAGTANDLTVNIDDSSITQDGILKNYYTDGIVASDISKNDNESIEIPLKVSKYATGGMKNLKVTINYKDESGTPFTLTESIYVEVAAVPTQTVGAPNLVISKVEQSTSKPEAGDKVTVSFYIQNKGNVDANELKVYADNLSSTTFIPVESEPYQYIEKLKAGEKVRISIPLIVSNSITEGLNNLSVKYTYTGGDGSVMIPVRDVQNDVGTSSKPKLIVSKYVTDSDKLVAGSTFNFTYDIYNTNATVAAKNITVTISQADNIFTVTQGSNSFFINKIAPGETVENTIEMKVKSDATTKAYPIKLTIEYEYDGAEPNKETGAVGETRTEELNLQAAENARPVADNIQVYTFDGNPVTVGNPATLSFGFYNMGKAVLSNVTATVEGDSFVKTDGGMYFIGNVEAGASSLVEFEVLPNMEGEVTGTLKISYEDSNGETIEFTKDFTSSVMAPVITDPTMPGDGSGEVFNPEVSVAKAAIVPIWAFVLIQVAVFVIFLFVTRKVILSVYKAKLRRKEENQY